MLWGKKAKDLQSQREAFSLSHLVPKELAETWGIPFYNTMSILPCGHIAQQLVFNDRCRLCVRDERNEQAWLSKQALDLLS